MGSVSFNWHCKRFITFNHISRLTHDPVHVFQSCSIAENHYTCRPIAGEDLVKDAWLKRIHLQIAIDAGPCIAARGRLSERCMVEENPSPGYIYIYMV